MNLRIILSILIISLLPVKANAYTPNPKKDHSKLQKTSLASSLEDNYDVKYLRFNLYLTDTSVFVKGDVATTALVTAATMSNYVFELDTLMVIDSAKVNGTILPVTVTSGYIRNIALPIAMSAGSMFTAQIYYHGVPPAGGGFFNGLTHAVSSHGTHMIYTVSDPWVAQNWWPAKQSATDKIDSMDMFITVPRGVVDGSNGKLVNVDTSTTPGFWKYHWQTHYPIDYYLISIAVARYAEYKSYMHFSGSSDSMLVQNFLMDTATFNPLYKANFDSIGQIIDFYSSLFGRYPFWQEKYGVCYTNLGGGMENQTMTTIGTPDITVIAHELMHQWFGDHVTYARWGEMWLSEGFATFSEELYLARFHSAAEARTRRQSHLASALSPVCGQTFVTDTSGPTTLFNTATVYNKGHLIVTMLRNLAPTDSQFFLSLRTYQQKYAFGNANVANLNSIVDSIYGYNLDSFFSQWIYGYGYPKYTVHWNQVGSSVYVKLVQTPSCNTHPTHFNTPVELQLHSPYGDTIVMPYNTLDSELFIFNWADSMSNVVLNPNFMTICRLNSPVTRDISLGVIDVQPNIKLIATAYPNPSHDYWHLEFNEANTPLILTDIKGNTVWMGFTQKGITQIPGANLPTGNYLLKVICKDSLEVSLIKE